MELVDRFVSFNRIMVNIYEKKLSSNIMIVKIIMNSVWTVLLYLALLIVIDQKVNNPI